MFRWGSGGMIAKSASEVEDDRLLDQLQEGFNAQNRKKRQEMQHAAQSCAHCDDSLATIPCVDQCGDTFYCSNDCVLRDARRHRAMCLSIRLSLCEDDKDDPGDDDLGGYGEDNPIDTDEVVDTSYPKQGEADSTFVDNFNLLSVQRNLQRVESIEVACPQCNVRYVHISHPTILPSIR
ncbi:hypothetical protein, variant [Aphanomyces astaci]|uniref:MYND-type domain-containing protein n=1 Tax=Aphanomyces astaci TaxID=112090 RepID=W4GNN8_APHAT|nr:hypothetical protein, variant [Aphanomyces astaci]ETV80498.1 hypothetical protein, variant [Aphanomyces astaci]|eukprot:XP_009830422.1 hypothetical protein, variant [Aphanomyces astaci]